MSISNIEDILRCSFRGAEQDQSSQLKLKLNLEKESLQLGQSSDRNAKGLNPNHLLESGNDK